MKKKVLLNNIALLLLSFLLAYYLNFLAYNVYIKFFNLLVFTILIVYSFINLKQAILINLGIGLLCLEYPRDILSFTIIEKTTSIDFFTLTSQSFGPFTLFQYLIFFHVFIVILYLYKTHFKYLAIILISLCLSVGFFGLIHTFVFKNNFFSFNTFFTDLKFPILLFSGFILGSYLRSYKKIFENYLITIVIIAGYRVLCYLLMDIITHNVKLDFSALSYLALSIMVYYIITDDKKIFKSKFVIIGLVLNFLNTSRMFYLVFAFTLFYCIVKYNKKQNLKLFLRFLIIVISFIIFFMILFLPDLFKFVLWKFNVFNEVLNRTNMSGSGKVRIYEFLNIFTEATSNLFFFIFGKGYGGSYFFEHYPLSLIGDKLGLDSFSADQLSTNKFYTTHNFLSFNLLKTGIIGTVLYLFIPIKVVVSKNENVLFRSISLISLLLIYYWRPEMTILMGIIFVI